MTGGGARLRMGQDEDKKQKLTQLEHSVVPAG